MEIGDTIKILNDNYLILDILDYYNNKYYFLNKLDNGNISEIHEIYKFINNVFIKEENQDIIDKILPIIQNDLTGIFKELMEDNDEE